MDSEEMREREQMVPPRYTALRYSARDLRSQGPLRMVAKLAVPTTKRFIGRKAFAGSPPRRLGSPREHWVLILIIMVLLALLMVTAILYEASVRSDALWSDLFTRIAHGNRDA